LPILVQPQTFRRHDRHTTEVTISGERFRLIAGRGPDWTLGQVTIGWVGHGSGASGLLGGYATALSLGLEHGVPLTELLRPGLGLRFAPDGRTDDPEIPGTYSAVDYCCRRLAIDWLPYRERAALGVFTRTERGRQLDRRGPEGAPHPIDLTAYSTSAPLRARGLDVGALLARGIRALA
jgi:hypothetical protein